MDKIQRLLQRSTQKIHEWVQYYNEELNEDYDPQLALTYLRATLQVLRDHLEVHEGAHLSAQLPIFLRGLYYEGWRPLDRPVSSRTKEDFLFAIRKKLNVEFPYIDHEQATRAALHTIFSKLSQGEMEDVISNLHHRVRDIFETLPPNEARLA